MGIKGAILLISTLVGHADQFYKLWKVAAHFAKQANKKQVVLKDDHGYAVKQPIGETAALDLVIAKVTDLALNYAEKW